MPRPLLPPRYVNVPAALVYDLQIRPVVRDTYAMLRGLAWDKTETPAISWEEIVRITGKPVSTIYAHLAALRDRGWLLFNHAGVGMIIVHFLDRFSEKSELLNEDVLTDSVNQEHPLPNQSLDAEKFRKIRRIPKNQKNNNSNNGWHDVIDADLEDLLERVGVFPEKFRDVAASGWKPEQIKKLAEKVLDELGPGNGGGVFIYRLINRDPPQTDADYWRTFLASDWGQYVEH